MASASSATMRTSEPIEMGGVGIRDNELQMDDSDFEDDSAQGLLNNGQSAYSYTQSSIKEQILRCIPFTSKKRPGRRRQNSDRRSVLLSISFRRFIVYATAFAIAVLLITAALFPSYTSPPTRYYELRSRVKKTESADGAGNPNNEKVFIAASIFDKDGSLARGKWAECVLNLIHILGPTNVYLSIYENDAGATGKAALSELDQKVPCKHTLRFDDHLAFNEVEHITLPDGSKRTRRIAYLSEARNRALLPLRSSLISYDKVLYLNDVVFDPVEAAQLLFLTGSSNEDNASGSLPRQIAGNDQFRYLPTRYRAACAVDFVNPVKFYDTFATRDHEGYGVGLPLYPWFTTAGQGLSRKQVQTGSDAVEVRSCWGGMVAFDASFFQPQFPSSEKRIITAASEGPANLTTPYRFRSEEELYWDASECCLIHADIQNPGFDPSHPEKYVSGIYMNPYIRTAYDYGTLRWLNTVRRFERLLSPIHWTLTKIVGMPWFNPRRSDIAGSNVERTIWVPNTDAKAPPGTGSFQIVNRPASHSGFCGSRSMELMKTPENMAKGGKPWEFAPIPVGGTR